MKRINPWLVVPGVALAAASAYVAAAGPGGNREAALAGIGVLLVWSVALAVRARYPDRPLWILLGALTVACAMQPMVSASNLVLLTLARAARPGIEVLLVWLMLAFPTGRLTTWRERALVIAAAAAVLLLWLPGMMFSARIPPFGPFAACGADCPSNLFFVADRPQWSALLLQAFRIVGAVILLATTLHLIVRLRDATALMRRSLAPVVVASVARTLTIAVLLATGVATLALNLTLWGVPLAIALGLLRGRLYTARALHRLVTGLRRRPSMRELRDVMAEALGDPSLELGAWHADERRWVDAAQRTLQVPAADAPGRAARVLQDAEGRPIALLIHDRALLEEPLLLDAVVSSMESAIASVKVESALAGARARSAIAVEEERRRIERDLHDGAQQRLLALRMKLSVTGRLLDNDPRRAMSLLGEMGSDIDAAIAELRTLAHGVAPPLLTERGLTAALAEAAQHAAIPVATELQEVGHSDPAAERAVYFCCVEAMQNAAKHAGAGASARLTLRREGDALQFSVVDTGCGPGAAEHLAQGQGLRNMRERISALGGQLEVGAADPTGLRVIGTVPLNQPA